MSVRKVEVGYVREVSILCLTIICIYAIHKGIDSTLLATISAIIGGIAGYTLKVKRGKSEE